MMEDADFFNNITSEKMYLSFSNEIEYLTGLQRNNKNIIEMLSTRLDESYLKILKGIDIDIRYFEKIKLDNSIFESATRDELVKQLQEHNLDDKARDQIIEFLIYEPALGQAIKRHIYHDYRNFFWYNLKLFSIVIKNCELIGDLDFKKASVDQCIKYWAKFIIYFIIFEKKFIGFIKYYYPISACESDEHLSYFIKIFFPVEFRYLIHQYLGTEKFELILSDRMENPSEFKLTNMIDVFLYSEMQLDGYIDRLRDLIKNCAGNKYILEIIFHFMEFHYLTKKLSREERIRMENLIGDLFINRRSSGKRRVDERNKTRFIGNLKSLFLLVKKN